MALDTLSAFGLRERLLNPFTPVDFIAFAASDENAYGPSFKFDLACCHAVEGDLTKAEHWWGLAEQSRRRTMAMYSTTPDGLSHLALIDRCRSLVPRGPEVMRATLRETCRENGLALGFETEDAPED